MKVLQPFLKVKCQCLVACRSFSCIHSCRHLATCHCKPKLFQEANYNEAMKRERQKQCKKSKSKPEVFCIFYSFCRTKTLKQIVFLLNDLEICIFVLVWFDFSAIKDNGLMVFWTSSGPQKSMFNRLLRGSLVKSINIKSIDFQPFS